MSPQELSSAAKIELLAIDEVVGARVPVQHYQPGAEALDENLARTRRRVDLDTDEDREEGVGFGYAPQGLDSVEGLGDNEATLRLLENSKVYRIGRRLVTMSQWARSPVAPTAAPSSRVFVEVSDTDDSGAARPNTERSVSYVTFLGTTSFENVVGKDVRKQPDPFEDKDLDHLVAKIATVVRRIGKQRLAEVDSSI